MNVEIFNHQDLGQIRVLGNYEKPYFIAMDIAKILGYANTMALTKRLQDDEVTNLKKLLKSNMAVELPKDARYDTILITESGLYASILWSQKPEAKPFRQWITSEVLPSIRKTGSYSISPKIPANMIEALELALNQAKHIQTLENKIDSDTPLVNLATQITQSDGSLSIGDFAKVLCKKGLNIGQKRLFEFLRQEGFLNNKNIPYQRFIQRKGNSDLLKQRCTKIIIKDLK